MLTVSMWQKHERIPGNLFGIIGLEKWMGAFYVLCLVPTPIHKNNFPCQLPLGIGLGTNKQILKP